MRCLHEVKINHIDLIISTGLCPFKIKNILSFQMANKNYKNWFYIRPQKKPCNLESTLNVLWWQCNKTKM
jgi:hypothetical protein